jgi:hypothetical protein
MASPVISVITLHSELSQMAEMRFTTLNLARGVSSDGSDIFLLTNVYNTLHSGFSQKADILGL